jgi:hypothetical protein
LLEKYADEFLKQMSRFFNLIYKNLINFSSDKVADLVHPSLKNDASTLNTLIIKFGKAVEQLLKMHRKNIIGLYYNNPR